MIMVRDTAVVFAQTPLLKSQLEELKRLSGTASTKDALQAAVNHYLSCTVIREREEESERKKAKKEGEKKEDWWWSPEEKEER